MLARQWYHDVGFSSNPFSIKPGAFHNELVGYNLNSTLDNIDSGCVVFIEGEYGSGKTTLMKQIIRRFGGKRKVIYYNCSAQDQLNTRKLLLGRSFLSKTLKVLPSDMILIVDEAQDFKLQDSQDMMAYFPEHIKSAVFVGVSYNRKSFTNELNKQLNGNIIRLNRLTPEQAVELVRKRVGNLPILPDDVIKEAYKRSGLNPRALLENCEDLCRHAVEKGADKITEGHINAVLKKAQAPKKKKRRMVKKRAKKPAKPKEQEIEIQEISSDTSKRVGFEYNVENIRTYEEEMATIKTNDKLL